MTAAAPPATAAPSARYFYVAISGATVLLAFGGFTATYWAPMAGGTLSIPAATHVHAALFFTWTLLFFAQTWLAANRNIALHRELGMFGLLLAGAMLVAGELAAIISLREGMGTPREQFVRNTFMLASTSMLMFAVFMGFAIVNIKRPEWHKRLMVLASIALLQAVFARVFFMYAQPTRGVFAGLAVDVFLLVVVLADWRLRGRIHPVFLWGGAFLLFVQYARLAVIPTPFWTDVIHWAAALP